MQEEKASTAMAQRSPSSLASVAAEWELQQNVYRPERDAGLAALVECLTLAGQPGAPVVDLACGTGSVAARVLARHPDARVIGIDRDPVLLAVAGAVFHDTDRVTLRRADLTDRAWFDAVNGQPVAVLSAAALHWLDEPVVRALYADLAKLLPIGAVFANLDWFPLEAPALAAFSGRVVADREAKALNDNAGMSWSEWWSELTRQDELRPAFAERDALQLPRSAEFIRPAEWHQAELRAAGFTEAGVIWRSFSSAVLVALR
jgi:SAM-dependent methyltransferase